MRQKMELKGNDKTKSFKEGFEEFILHYKIKNLSEYTIKYYYNVVRIWVRYFNGEEPISIITTSTVNGFIMFLREEMNENDTTINTNIVGIRVILYYFMKLGYLPQFKISKTKANKEIIETYTEAEIEILLKKPNLNKCTFIEYRNWVVINFFLGTGCRISTLINMIVQDIDFENQLITYRHTKNRKQQIVPLSNNLKKVLVEYLEYRKPSSQEDFLFVNAYGDKLRNCLLSQNLCDYNRKRGVMKTGVHRWRHTFAKLWILQGGDIFRLQKILSHSDLEIIKNYVNMFTNDLQKDFEKFNPISKKQFISM